MQTNTSNDASADAIETTPANPASAGSLRLKLAWAIATFAFVSFAASWQFAVLLMCTVGFHEQGHVWAMRQCGVQTKGFYFLLFLGGVAIATERPKHRGEDSYIVLMGPAWGLALALLTLALAEATGHPFLAASAWFMAAVNLFNLLPVNPLDGGRLLIIVAESSGGARAGKMVHTLSVVAFLAATATGLVSLPLGLLGSLMCFLESRNYGKREDHPTPVSRRGSIRTVLAYVALSASLIAVLKSAQWHLGDVSPIEQLFHSR